MDLLTSDQVAEIRGCSIARLEKERKGGTGLAYVKDGRAVRYLRRDVEAFIEALPRIEPIA